MSLRSKGADRYAGRRFLVLIDANVVVYFFYAPWN